MDNIKLIQQHDQSGFSHYCACWANNHSGWAKMKKAHHKRAMKQVRIMAKKEIKEQIFE